MAQIYIVEDHPVMRQGYAALVEAEMGLEICGKTGSAPEARQEIPEMEPDLAIIDLSLEEGSGLEVVKDLQNLCPDLSILVVSVHDEELYAERVLQAGASGYLTKNEPAEKVIKAIHRILEGGMFFGEKVRDQMLFRFQGGNPEKVQPMLEDLSDRELEVFEYMGRGLTSSEIAEALNLSPKTIDTYRGRAKEKLGLDSNAELRRRAVMWIELDKPEL
jgi:DNA-binding NarL/FixJ family response regulator